MADSKSNVPVEQQQVIDDIVKKINKLKPEQQALLAQYLEVALALNASQTPA